MCCRTKSHRRHGLSLIEVLVVITIIAVLIGLILPAVQKVREAANRAKCQNNLKQIGLAVQNYHDANKSLPPSYIRQDWCTWAVLILPYIEQQNTYSGWDPQLRYYEQPNRGTSADPTAQMVPIYLCPSRRDASVGLSVAAGNTVLTEDVPSKPDYGEVSHRPGALGDYAACNGTNGNVRGDGALVIGIALKAEKPNGKPYSPLRNMSGSPPGTRITSWKSQSSFADITDGTSQTLMIGEKHVRPESRWGKDEDRSIYDGASLDTFLRMAGKSDKRPPVPVFPLVSDPNDSWASPVPIRESFHRFGSWHPGVCLFVFCDGSVRPVNNSADDITLGRLAGRADGKPIEGDY